MEPKFKELDWDEIQDIINLLKKPQITGRRKQKFRTS